MKMTANQPKSQRIAEPMKKVSLADRRLDPKMIIMIEECINRRFCQMKRAQMKERRFTSFPVQRPHDDFMMYFFSLWQHRTIHSKSLAYRSGGCGVPCLLYRNAELCGTAFIFPCCVELFENFSVK